MSLSREKERKMIGKSPDLAVTLGESASQTLPPNSAFCNCFSFFNFLKISNPFLFYEWEHRVGILCPFSSLHPLGEGIGR